MARADSALNVSAHRIGMKGEAGASIKKPVPDRLAREIETMAAGDGGEHPSQEKAALSFRPMSANSGIGSLRWKSAERFRPRRELNH